MFAKIFRKLSGQQGVWTGIRIFLLLLLKRKLEAFPRSSNSPFSSIFDRRGILVDIPLMETEMVPLPHAFSYCFILDFNVN